MQAVAFNYPVAVLLSFVFLKPDFHDFDAGSTWWVFGSLGVLLPFIFVIMGKAVQSAGIVRSDTAQRLSLILTLMIAFFVWNEPMSNQKLVGVGLALVALGFLLVKQEKTKKKSGGGFLYLLLVWLGYGTIDLMFKLISRTSGNSFSTTLTLSFTIATILIFAYLFIKKAKFNVPSMLGGLVLGLLNFTNIYTYITAHKHLGDSPSLVFTGMNIGVIALGTLVGLFVFNEKLNKYNYIGIGIAILAIVMLFVRL